MSGSHKVGKWSLCTADAGPHGELGSVLVCGNVAALRTFCNASGIAYLDGERLLKKEKRYASFFVLNAYNHDDTKKLQSPKLFVPVLFYFMSKLQLFANSLDSAALTEWLIEPCWPADDTRTFPASPCTHRPLVHTQSHPMITARQP